MIFSFFNSIALIACIRLVPRLEDILMTVQGTKPKAQQRKHSEHVEKSVRHRLDNPDKGDDSEDFMSAFEKGLSEDNINMAEINKTVTVLIVRGSEIIGISTFSYKQLSCSLS